MQNEVAALLLLILGLITGFIGTNTGGSVLLTVPIMMWLGINPQSAIANARLASLGTTAAGIFKFHEQNKIDYSIAIPATLFSTLGVIIGSYCMIYAPIILLQKFIGLITLFLLTFSLIRERVNFHYKLKNKYKIIFGYLTFIVVGILGGFFGGQAILSTFVLQLFFNKTIFESIGTRKVSGLFISLISLYIYGTHGFINPLIGITLISGTLIGSYIGSAYALKKGEIWMQRVFRFVTLLLACKILMFD